MSSYYSPFRDLGSTVVPGCTVTNPGGSLGLLDSRLVWFASVFASIREPTG